MTNISFCPIIFAIQTFSIYRPPCIYFLFLSMLTLHTASEVREQRAGGISTRSALQIVGRVGKVGDTFRMIRGFKPITITGGNNVPTPEVRANVASSQPLGLCIQVDDCCGLNTFFQALHSL